MESTQNLSSLIWSSADDILRGVFKESEYGRVILPFIAMRRLDCVLESKKDEVYNLYEKYKKELDPSPIIKKQIGFSFYNYSKYDLVRLKSDPNNISINFKNYVQGFSSNVLDIIDNFELDPIIKKLEKNDRLYEVVNKFTEFDLHLNEIDNHHMGTVYEDLLRKFSEMSNEESGDHFTPRDVVKLLVSLIFGKDVKNLSGEGKIRSIYDPCCGTGGILTIGKQWVHENINPNLKIDLYGQELNDHTYAICKSDFLMMDENHENIHGPISSFSEDRFQGRKFDYMLTNPPYGVSWKSEKDFILQESKDPTGRFFAGKPRVSDGQLLFLQHLIHKMNPEGARIGIVLNSSALNTGDAGSGESEIRKWIIENDLLETIVMLPDRLFFNTAITTYIWILDNKKDKKRKQKIQIIDAKDYFNISKKKFGDKSKEINDDHRNQIYKIYEDFDENKNSKILNNSYFKYTKIIIDQFLRDQEGEIIYDKKGNPKIDKELRSEERVFAGNDINEYLLKNVKPNLDGYHYDESLNKVGYEISLTKEFYKAKKIRTLDEIKLDLIKIDKETQELKIQS